MTSPIFGNEKKDRLMFFGSSKALGSERYSRDISNDQEEGQGVLGIVLQGRVVKNILSGSQAYYSRVIALKDEIVAVGVNAAPAIYIPPFPLFMCLSVHSFVLLNLLLSVISTCI